MDWRSQPCGWSRSSRPWECGDWRRKFERRRRIVARRHGRRAGDGVSTQRVAADGMAKLYSGNNDWNHHRDGGGGGPVPLVAREDAGVSDMEVKASHQGLTCT